MLRLKRAYESPSKDDGKRILVERLWPRGLTKKEAAIDIWLKEISPSQELRKWYAHDLKKWSEFRKRYRRELQENREAVEELKKLFRKGPVTLIFAARDVKHSSAIVLRKVLEEK